MKPAHVTHPASRSRALLLAVLIMTALWCAPGVQAQQSLMPAQPAEQPPAQQETEQSSGEGAAVSQKKALELVRARFPGTVISINEVRQRNGVLRYRVRMDNEGNIFTLYVNSTNGAISRE